MLNKMQALYKFWSGFGLEAYDEHYIPDNAVMPYITYESASDNFGTELALTGSLYYRSTSWKDITEKEMQIANTIGRGGTVIEYDNGAFWVRKGTPWAQRLNDANDDMVRRIVLNIEVEFMD